MKSYGSIILTSSFMLFAAVLIVTLDRSAAVSLDGRFWAIAVGTSMVVVAPSTLRFREIRCLIPFIAFIVFLMILPFVELSPVKAYRKFFGSISPGLTQTEVLDSLRRYFPDYGRYSRPQWTQREDGSLHFWLDPSDGRYDAETITVTFWQDRTFTKVYMKD